MLRILTAAFVAAGVACTPVGASEQVRTIHVRIHHSAFDASAIEAEPGERVRLVVHNADPIDHEFIVGDEGVQRAHERGTETHHGARPGEISVPAGTTRSTTYTFGEPGGLIFGCHLPGHYAYGMRGVIAVG